MSGGFDNGVFDTAVFDESSKTISLILAKPFNESASWMTYIAISGSDATPEGFLLDEFYRKLGTVKVVRNTYFISATFGQDEPGKEGYFDRSTDSRERRFFSAGFKPQGRIRPAGNALDGSGG